MSISKKILSAFFCVILLTIISICVVIGLQMHKTSIEAFYSSSAKELTQISRAVDIFMDSALKMTRLAAEIPFIPMLMKRRHYLRTALPRVFWGSV